jgi:hypothetical protein
MTTIQHLPTLFEYYSAIHLTKERQSRYYVYNDLPDSHKRNAGFPLTDKGVDLVDETWKHIVQVKYYGSKQRIHYGKLSTFLGTPLLVGQRHLNLTLVRTYHCKLHSEIHRIVQRGDLKDITLHARDFLKFIHR